MGIERQEAAESLYPDIGDEKNQRERILGKMEEGQFDILELIMQKFNMT